MFKKGGNCSLNWATLRQFPSCEQHIFILHQLILDSLEEMGQTMFCDITDVFDCFWLSWTSSSQNHWEHKRLSRWNVFIDKIQNGCHIIFKKNTFGHIFVHNWHRNLILMLKYMFWRSSNPWLLRHEIVFYLTLIGFLFTKCVELLRFSLSFQTEKRILSFKKNFVRL